MPASQSTVTESTASLSHEQRRASAAESFAIFAPGAAPAQVADALARRQGALGAMAFDVVGAMWSRPQLKRRDRSLMVISVLAAQARDDELVLHTQVGLRNGLAQTEIEEILLHVAAYAGYPAAMASSRRVDQGLREALKIERLPDRAAHQPKSDAERDRDGASVLSTIAGAAQPLTGEEGLARMRSLLGEVGVTAYRWAFGEIWSRPELSRRDRSIVVIAILISLGAVAELAVHFPAGLCHGLTRVELEEIVNHLSLYAGIPRAVEAMRALRAAFARIDEAK
ncbi:MAG TPA: carboxymuconolactone decarboxylase family protein [Caulobacteraceae bacterium]|jgi:4-carboxymuconolactone decarboxylase